MALEQLVSDTRTALVNTIASFQYLMGGVISVQELLELLTKTYDILDIAVFKLVGNTAHILAFF